MASRTDAFVRQFLAAEPAGVPIVRELHAQHLNGYEVTAFEVRRPHGVCLGACGFDSDGHPVGGGFLSGRTSGTTWGSWSVGADTVIFVSLDRSGRATRLRARNPDGQQVEASPVNGVGILSISSGDFGLREAQIEWLDTDGQVLETI